MPDAADRHALLRSILPPAFAMSEASLARLSACTSGFVAADIVALKRHALALALARRRHNEEVNGRRTDACNPSGQTHSRAEAGEGGGGRLPGLEDLEAALPHIRPTALRGESLQVGAMVPLGPSRLRGYF